MVVIIMLRVIIMIMRKVNQKGAEEKGKPEDHTRDLRTPRNKVKKQKMRRKSRKT